MIEVPTAWGSSWSSGSSVMDLGRGVRVQVIAIGCLPPPPAELAFQGKSPHKLSVGELGVRLRPQKHSKYLMLDELFEVRCWLGVGQDPDFDVPPPLVRSSGSGWANEGSGTPVKHGSHPGRGAAVDG